MTMWSDFRQARRVTSPSAHMEPWMPTIKHATALFLLSAALLSLPACQDATQTDTNTPSKSLAPSPPGKDFTALDASARQSLIQAVRTRAQTPTQFLASRFDKYDLVFLGEVHHVRDTCQFVAASLPALYSAGARQLAPVPCRF